MVSLYKSTWKACHSSVCSIRFLNGNDIEIVSVTGFKSGDYLFTHDMVNRLHKAEFVEIKFVKEDGHTIAAIERLSLHDFSERIITSYDQEITGFSMISIVIWHLMRSLRWNWQLTGMYISDRQWPFWDTSMTIPALP